MYLGKGDGSFTYHGPGINSYIGSDQSLDVKRVKFADPNGDGLIDIYHATRDIAYPQDKIYYNRIDSPGTFEREGVDAGISSTGRGGVYLTDFSGDGIDDIYQLPTDASHTRMGNAYGAVHAWHKPPQLVEQVRDGFGKTTQFAYSTLLDSSVYTADSEFNSYPTVALNGPLPIVKHLFEDNGDGFNQINYQYKNLRFNKRGAGMLGFSEHTITHLATNTVQHAQFSQNFDDKTVGRLLLETTTNKGAELNRVLYDYGFKIFENVEYTLPLNRTQIQRDLNGAHISTIITETEYGTKGTSDWVPTSKETCISDQDPGAISSTLHCDSFTAQHLKTDTYEYYPRSSFDYLGPKLQHQINEVKNLAGYDSLKVGEYETKTAYSWYSNGQLQKETFEHGKPHSLTKEYYYNNYGQQTQLKVSGPDIIDRSTYHIYAGRQLVKKQNAYRHTTEYKYTDGTHFWQPTETISADGSNSQTYYDSLGRAYQTQDTYNNTSTEERRWCDSCNSRFPESEFKIIQSRTNQADQHIYFDRLARQIGTETEGLFDQGQTKTIVTKQTYNHLGNVTSSEGPYFIGDPDKPITNTIYDDLGRPVIARQKQSIHAGSSGLSFNTALEWVESSITYQGREVRYTDSKNRTRAEKSNALGQIIEALDKDNNVLKYTYDANGSLVKTIDPMGNEIISNFDIVGRKVSMSDPNQGSWTYTYYADGTLKSQTDSKEQTTEMDYDLLGRMIERRDVAPGETAKTSRWVYDENTKGALYRETSTGFQRTFIQTRDSLGRMEKAEISTSIEGEIFGQTTHFNQQGRVSSIDYPQGFVATHHYHPSLGVLEKITDQASQQLWKLQAGNAYGQTEAYQLGNNFSVTKMYDPYSGRLSQIRGYSGAQTHIEQYYSWGSQGNLKARKDEVQNLFEAFTYDSLDRLTENRLSGSTSKTDSVSYNAIGNITHKGGLGAYTYGQTTCGQKAGPHAVTNIQNQAGEFCYDANGNQTSGLGRNIKYTSFNKPSRITKNNKTTQFWYDTNRSRYKRQDDQKTTYYMGVPT